MAATNAVDITYVPADCGSVIPGKSKAPAAFQEVGLVEKLKAAPGILSVAEYQALDSPALYKTVPFQPGRARNEDLNVSVCQQVQAAITQNLNHSTSTTETTATSTTTTTTTTTTSPAIPSSNPSKRGKPAFQLIIGGECGMLPGIMSALWTHGDGQTPAQRVGLIYIDADTDLASPTDADSTGIFAGMNMTHLTLGPGSLQPMTQFKRTSTNEAVCTPSNTVFFGTNMALHSNQRSHLAHLHDADFKVISSASVARDPESRARAALAHLTDRHPTDLIMVHLDVDSIDPRMFPLANVPNYTGVGFECMMSALNVLMACDRVVGLSVAEVNPDHDPDRGMITRLTDCIVDMLASRAR